MSTYRTEQQKKRKQAESKKATKTVAQTAPKKQKSSKKVVKPAKVKVSKSVATTRKSLSSISQPVATKSGKSSVVSTPASVKSTADTANLTPSSVPSATTTPSPTIAHLAESVGRASANVNAPTSLYPAYLAELSAEGVTRQLLQHAQMKPVALGQLKAHVRTIRSSGIHQKAIWQLIGGGSLLALGILPQVVVFPFGPLFISLYQVLLNSLTIALGNNGILPAVLVALIQVVLIGGGATLTTLGVLNQAKFDAWKLSEEIANRV